MTGQQPRPPDPVRMTGEVTAEPGRLAGERASRWRRAPGTVEPFLAESRLNVAGVAIVALVLLLAVFGPLIAPQNPDQINLFAVLQPPSVHHWFGTDNLGRDLFSRVLVGTRISVEVGVIILSLSVVFGTALGIVSGLAGGLADEENGAEHGASAHDGRMHAGTATAAAQRGDMPVEPGLRVRKVLASHARTMRPGRR